MDKAFDRTTFALVIVATAVIIYAYKKTGDIPWPSIERAMLLFVNIVPKLICGFLIGVVLLEVLPREFVETWLSDDSGWRGIAIAWGAGSVMPLGAPALVLPMMAGLLQGGLGVGPAVTFLTATALLGPGRILTFEIPIMGTGFFLLRFLSVFWVPPISGFIAQFIVTRTGWNIF